VDLADFLHETGLEIEDIYGSASIGGWAGLRRLAGLDLSTPGRDDRELGRAIVLDTDDRHRLDLLNQVAAGSRPDAGRLVDMLHFQHMGPAIQRVDVGSG
jgi:hypothetical protein